MDNRTAADASSSPLVLVVEDESMIRMCLSYVLEDEGYRVIEAESADAAVLQLESQPDIQVVITDIRMPGSMDGLGLAAWMLRNRPTLPIVVTTGFETAPDIASINPAIARVVTKPYRAQDVAGWLKDLGCAPAAGK